VGRGPAAIAIAPDGATAYVVNYFDKSVTPIKIATSATGSAIKLGNNPVATATTT
jgi:DNA-binding beta-propeller fold protein YncE